MAKCMLNFYLAPVLLLVFGLLVKSEDDLFKGTTPERVRKNGYPVETHYVTTDDGYILQLHRIPYGKKTKMPAKGDSLPTFFLQHGLTASSDHWVENKYCLPFALVDAGYDVWMGNTRGSPYSRNHTFHDVESETFWDFSFDEMAKYDLPAMIKYAVETSNPDDNQLHYVGHSQGTMIAFAGLSQDDDLQMYIKSFFALAPVARLDYLYKPIKVAARLGYGMKWLLDKTGIIRIPLPLNELNKFQKLLCEVNKHFCVPILENMKNEIPGFDWEEAEATLNDTLPEGTACVKNIAHYCQIMASRVFGRYDYGTFGNLLWYWSKKAPAYELTNINDIPVKLIYGGADPLSAEPDVKWIQSQIGKDASIELIHKFNHLDFLRKKEAHIQIYLKIIKEVKDMNSRHYE